jgi:hypothetical protein
MSKIWQKNFNKLCEFKTIHGHTNVPKSYHDTKLARIVISLRQQKRNNSLKPERELALLQLGFDFDPHETKWQANYQSVVEYYRLNGHTTLNRRSDNEHERALAEWVHRMHKLVRQGQLEEDKIAQLKLVNIDGDPGAHRLNEQGLPAAFAQNLERLMLHIQRHGNELDSSMLDQSLYQWVKFQDKRIKAALITPREFTSLIRTDMKLAEVQSGNIIQFVPKVA